MRANSLEKSMSQYLIDQIRSKFNIRTVLRSQVTAVYGDSHLTAIDIFDRGANELRREESGGLFVFIGADAETGWLPPEIARDPRGYILTGGDVVKAGRWKESATPIWSRPAFRACSRAETCGSARSSASPPRSAKAASQLPLSINISRAARPRKHRTSFACGDSARPMRTRLVLIKSSPKDR